MPVTLRHPEFLSSAERLRARKLMWSDRASFDGTWWPESLDLNNELRVLLPMLDRVRGPVRRLVLSAEGWAAVPDRVVINRRTVDVDYPGDWSPWTMTVVCVDGGTFTMRVVPPGPTPASPDRTDARREADAGGAAGGGLGSSGGERSDDPRGPGDSRAHNGATRSGGATASTARPGASDGPLRQ